MLDRLKLLLNDEQINKIKKLNILIVGVGGVGGYALESLVRTGVSNITIIDNDVVEKSNLNRQIISLNNNIGEDKVSVAKERCLSINPECNINVKKMFLDKNNISYVCWSLTNKAESASLLKSSATRVLPTTC